MRPKRDLGCKNHIRAGDEGRTRLDATWLPGYETDLVPGFVLVGLETFECAGIEHSLLVFQHRGMAGVLRECGLLDEYRRHPACEFVLIPGASPNVARWLANGGVDFSVQMEPVRPSRDSISLSRRVFTTVTSGVFVVDEPHRSWQQPSPAGTRVQADERAWSHPRGPGEIPVLAVGTKPPLLVARTCFVQELWVGIILPFPRNPRFPELGGPVCQPHSLCPVTGVSWHDAMDQCAELGMRLPRQDEWSFAMRGGSDKAWFFGNEEREIHKYAWLRPAPPAIPPARVAPDNRTHPVAELLPNAYGLYDMLGNIDEMLAPDREYLRFPLMMGSFERVITSQGGYLVVEPPAFTGTEPEGNALLGFRPVRDLDMRSIRKLAAAGHLGSLFFPQPAEGTRCD